MVFASPSRSQVVANAVAALSEIAETSGRDVFMVTTSVLQKLLAALNECTEWGQVFILDSLARYTPADEREAEGIIERVTPRLQHVNSAVVLCAVKVVMRYLDVVTNTDSVRALTRKLAPPLVTLLSTEPEIQYVALRNINLIVQKRPAILSHEIKVCAHRVSARIWCVIIPPRTRASPVLDVAIMQCLAVCCCEWRLTRM